MKSTKVFYESEKFRYEVFSQLMDTIFTFEWLMFKRLLVVLSLLGAVSSFGIINPRDALLLITTVLLLVVVCRPSVGVKALVLYLKFSTRFTFSRNDEYLSVYFKSKFSKYELRLGSVDIFSNDVYMGRESVKDLGITKDGEKISDIYVDALGLQVPLSNFTKSKKLSIREYTKKPEITTRTMKYFGDYFLLMSQLRH